MKQTIDMEQNRSYTRTKKPRGIRIKSDPVDKTEKTEMKTKRQQKKKLNERRKSQEPIS